MENRSLTFDAIAEPWPGPKWAARWSRSWPAYRAWFEIRGGALGPSRQESEAALARYMPELVPLHRRLTQLAGGGDLPARFLATWCPPAYLGGCSLAARADAGAVRLVRNYDLSPDLNEGLLLRTEWTGTPVMGMVEFLWGLSDGINAEGLAVALAYGGSQQVARGFGVTTILRYVIETCTTVAEAVAVLKRVPSHMAYNITLADRHAATATVELLPGGGARARSPAIATNHQHGAAPADRAGFTRTLQRHDHLKHLFASEIAPDALGDAFLETPLFQRNYAEGFGTLFTAVYNPLARDLTLRWPGLDWVQRLDAFEEGRRDIRYHSGAAAAAVRQPGATAAFDPAAFFQELRPLLPAGAAQALEIWAEEASEGEPDWARFGQAFALWDSRGRTTLPAA